MDVAKTFELFLSNLAINNRAEISQRYRSITKILNKAYWDTESETSHSLQVGSYGRGTAINGISDLDMIFELPWSVHSRIDDHEGNGQSALIQEVKNHIKSTYSRTDIRGDGQVVVIAFEGYFVEVVPAFTNSDGTYSYPDTHDGGSWKITKPREEIVAISELDKTSNGHLKDLCRMVRAWKNKTGTAMGGLLIDTLCYNFFKSHPDYSDRGYMYYDWLARDFFEYLSQTDNDQQFWLAFGSNQKVHKKGNFVRRAKKAYEKCKEAIEKQDNQSVNNTWKEVFGRPFPASEKVAEAVERSFRDTEEFIDDRFEIDIRYSLNIDCRVSQSGFKTRLLSWFLSNRRRLKFHKGLEFFVRKCDVPAPYSVRWKVRNVGPMAEEKDQIRGQILADGGRKTKRERTNFNGPHYVECYIVKDEVCMARDKIDVPIGG